MSIGSQLEEKNEDSVYLCVALEPLYIHEEGVGNRGRGGR